MIGRTGSGWCSQPPSFTNAPSLPHLASKTKDPVATTQTNSPNCRRFSPRLRCRFFPRASLTRSMVSGLLLAFPLEAGEKGTDYIPVSRAVTDCVVGQLHACLKTCIDQIVGRSCSREKRRRHFNYTTQRLATKSPKSVLVGIKPSTLSYANSEMSRQ